MKPNFVSIPICSNCGLRPVHHESTQEEDSKLFCMQPDNVEHTLNELTKHRMEWLRGNKYLYEDRELEKVGVLNG